MYAKLLWRLTRRIELLGSALREGKGRLRAIGWNGWRSGFDLCGGWRERMKTGCGKMR
jgi:hypothetical protein